MDNFLNFNSNDSLSNMKLCDKEELLNLLKEYKIELRKELNLNNNITFGLELEFGSNKEWGEKKDAFGIYAGLKQKLSNATFDFGVMMGKNVGPSISEAKAADEPFTFAVPLTITASF